MEIEKKYLIVGIIFYILSIIVGITILIPNLIVDSVGIGFMIFFYFVFNLIILGVSLSESVETFPAKIPTLMSGLTLIILMFISIFGNSEFIIIFSINGVIGVISIVISLLIE